MCAVERNPISNLLTWPGGGTGVDMAELPGHCAATTTFPIVLVINNYVPYTDDVISWGLC
jgi:hypothetical protein